MAKTVCILQGHPHGSAVHLCHAIADAYAEGAISVGAKVHRIDLGKMEISLLRDPADFVTAPPAAIAAAQEAVAASQHLVIIFPLWLGTMPAVVKTFFEQLCRNGFAIQNDGAGGFPKQMLKGRSARIIVTMGMPSLAYRFMFGAHGVRGFIGSILGLSGVKPAHDTLVGGVGALNPERTRRLLKKATRLGERLA